MNELEPRPNDYVYRRCPFCKADVDYFSLPWQTVVDRCGGLVRRRMGPCSHCGEWVRCVLVFPDEGNDMRGWLLEPVDPFESAQLNKGKQP
jgi:hypothetical protein